MTVEHLFNHSNGMYYELARTSLHALPPTYTAAHNREDPIGHFYRLSQVSITPGLGCRLP